MCTTQEKVNNYQPLFLVKELLTFPQKIKRPKIYKTHFCLLMNELNCSFFSTSPNKVWNGYFCLSRVVFQRLRIFMRLKVTIRFGCNYKDCCWHWNHFTHLWRGFNHCTDCMQAQYCNVRNSSAQGTYETAPIPTNQKYSPAGLQVESILVQS